MKKMIYISPIGKEIVFNDYVDNTKEYGCYWVEMCPHCHNKYKNILGNRPDDGGTAQGICSVEGCMSRADYYVDFAANEVKFA